MRILNFLSPIPQNKVVGVAAAAAGFVGQEAFYAWGMSSIPAAVSLVAGPALGNLGLALGGTAFALPFGVAAFSLAAGYGATVLGNAICKAIANKNKTVEKTDSLKEIIIKK